MDNSLKNAFAVEIPQKSREGTKIHTVNVSSIPEVVEVLHAWYDNDVRLILGKETARQHIHSIGEELDKQGGFTLMTAVARHTTARYPGLGYLLNNDWNKIGRWQA